MKKKLIFTGVSGGLFLLLIVLLKTFDVAAIGPMGTEIGFSALNGSVHDALPMNLFWYDLSEIFGTLALCVCGVFGALGAVQLVKGRSLLKVDRHILALGVFYVVVIGCYVLFELIVINYRPVIMPGVEGVEASFPSSHTMLSCCAMGSTVMVLKRFLSNRAVCMGLQAGCVLVAAVTVAARLMSGVHWFTDIIGGVLLSCVLLGLFAFGLEVLAVYTEKRGAHE